MIRDARVLRPEFVPQELVHRDAEVNHLAHVLEPLTRGEPTDVALLTGPSGTGKTCISRYMADRLQQETLSVETQYVNCWQNYSRFRTVYRILEGLGKTLDIHRQSTPHDELLERLRRYDGPPCLVILDEVDQLEDKRLLYDLHALSRFSLILIANREAELFTDLDDRLVSRLRGSERVQFDRYSTDALVEIMHRRVRIGLRDGAVDRSVLQTIADVAAGDARVALSILRSAARRAQQNHLETITASVAEQSIPDAEAEIRRKNLDTLTPHQRLLYEILDEHDELAPGDIYATYRERAENPKTDRTVRTYLSKMARYNLLSAEGSSRDRVYRTLE
ncbi:Cdc6/Cdc18 family protein [Natronobeatus ordinarius]|uniref:Cdc6/Cdc18 family protein n=1 Tax=Natronobeatus ordinarius TaxID=2963433 RepID=UPI0020CDF2FE|nr:Cdc6/Cdc18 family protein [Natronobeatus ordinarius]